MFKDKYLDCVFERCDNLKSVEINEEHPLIYYLDNYNKYYRRNKEKVKIYIKK